VVDDEGVPVVSDGDGVLENMQGFVVRSRVRSERLNSSCSDA
jgi:hypothetical protein